MICEEKVVKLEQFCYNYPSSKRKENLGVWGFKVSNHLIYKHLPPLKKCKNCLRFVTKCNFAIFEIEKVAFLGHEN